MQKRSFPRKGTLVRPAFSRQFRQTALELRMEWQHSAFRELKCTREAQTMKDSNVTVNLSNKTDDHPVAMLVQIASRFQSSIYMTEGSRRVNAKSIMGMMALGINNGAELYVSAEGEDEEDAISAISGYLLGEAI